MYFDKQEFMVMHNVLPIMLALCSMLSDTYYAHYYASIIGESLINCTELEVHIVVSSNVVQIKHE